MMTPATKVFQLTTWLLIAFSLAFFLYNSLDTINDPVFSIDFLPSHLACRLAAAGQVNQLTDYAGTGGWYATSGPFLDAFHKYYFPTSTFALKWVYLPGYVWIFYPLAKLEFPAAARVWLAVNTLLSVGSVTLLYYARPWKGDNEIRAWRAAWIVFFGATFQPVFDNMWHGNVSALIFFIFCLSYWLLRRQKHFLAGLVLGLIVLLKFYPALFILYFAWRRNRSLVAGAMVSCLAILAISVWTGGWAGNLEYFQMVWAELQRGGIPAFNNQSIAGFLLHTFTRGDVNAWQDFAAPSWLSGLRIALILVFSSAAAWAMRHHPETTPNPLMAQDLDLALVIGVMLLASPVAWYHYYIWLLFPILVVFDHLLASPAADSHQIGLFAIGYGLVVIQGIAVMRPFAAQALQDVWALRFILSQSFFGAVALIYLLWHMRLARAT